MARVVVCDGCPEGVLAPVLKGEPWDVIPCGSGESVLEAVVVRRPDVIVYGLRNDSHGEIAMLQLLRRAAPDVPLILIAPHVSLETQRALRELRPMYFDVQPFDPEELREAIRAAVSRSAA
jgi:DNA-binding NtrC family response regulator